MDNMKASISEGGLPTWSGEVTGLQATVAELKTELANLREKTEDMEGANEAVQCSHRGSSRGAWLLLHCLSL